MTVTDAPTEGMTISAAAEASGLSVDTLRYYEKEGLTLHRPGRSSSGQRRYTQENVAWLGTLVMLRRTGMPIRDIKKFVELYRVEGSEADRLAILEAHREHVLEELAEVQTHLAAINRKIDFYNTAVMKGK
ncbi:MerR family transcriptional regulator [Aeromicrobium fastidiosum]|uniref:MerR family transcriptional regulator n=1 Tax=Aeromicrobium fastidiosum TaxID=52699 RepID=A0A641APX0_9ACTN|nr:MerR family transcriptional regulator [Aeromicrobium fastidiosum]KAA1379985.1 MerR family transcriptional regulator [Aeromicrobium fastidiosum]MBP2389505.1 DNA-binding transcriptional MerR regulator [Aeromicrobium fastidiosum]